MAIIRDSRVYRLRARLLGHRRTPDKKHGRFNFHDNVKWYLRDVTKKEVVNDDPSSDVIYIDLDSFVKFAVRHIHEAL